MAETRFVPSLFTNANWSIPIGADARWDDVHKAWEADRLLKSRPAPRPIDIDKDDVLDQWTKNFRFSLARSHSHYERLGLPNMVPRVSFDVWRGMSRVSLRLAAGVFKGSQAMWLQLRPSGVNLSGNQGMPALHAAGLAPTVPEAALWHAETIAFFHALQKKDDVLAPWFALQRTATRQGDVDNGQPWISNPAVAFDALNLALREVRGTQHGSLPFQGLVPSFRSEQPDFDPLTLLALEDRTVAGPRTWGTRLLRIDLGAEAKDKKLLADIDWFSATREDYASKVLTGFTIRGRIDPRENPEQFTRQWDHEDGAQIAKAFQAMLAETSLDEPQLAKFKITDCELVQAPAGNGDGWLRLGSMEIRPTGTLPPTAKPGPTYLTFSAQGSVGSGATAVFPCCELHNLVCEIRYAAGDDPRREWVTLDAGQGEEERESVPIISRIEEKEIDGVGVKPMQGLLKIRTLSRKGFDATTEIRVEVQQEGRSARSARGSAVWLNLRPFMAALIDFPDRDKSTVTLVWRSDDPQGAQWRVEDPTVTAVLPPQAVVEEMERGDRFYDDPSKPNICSKEPILYRFSPPAYLTLWPSPVEQNRRFERSPINFRELMRGSYVKRLAFEMAYPLSIVYERSNTSSRQLMITEAGEFFGTPAARVAVTDDNDGRELPRPLAYYLKGLPTADGTAYLSAVKQLMDCQNLVHLNFVNRIAELHVLDPTRPREDMALSEDITIRLRDYAKDEVPLANPLPSSNPIDLSKVSNTFRKFLKHDAWAKEIDGAVRGGLIHSFEMPSELAEVLDTPTAVAGVVEALTLSVLGATGRMEASFASGKTSFAVVVAHGQLSRLVKTRIGRIGALWNKAKHVVVYERSAARSAQFADEQSHTDEFDRWPLLRKAEEYVEPIQAERNFYQEEQKESNTTGFLRASVFASPRIYVNGAWARDLGDGYELPLWDRAASEKSPKFYPKPKIFLECFGEEDRLTKLWFREPDRLYFFTSTSPQASAETDAWPPKAGVDFENLPRWDVIEKAPPDTATGLPQRKPASRDLCTSARFDVAVDPEGSVNLQHGRGKTPMLVLLDRISISRSSQSSPVDVMKIDQLAKTVETLGATAQVQQSARELAPTVQDLRSRIERLVGQRIDIGQPCSITEALLGEVDAAHERLLEQLDLMSNFGLAELLARERDAWLTVFAEINSQLVSRAMVADTVMQARAASLRSSIRSLRDRILSGQPKLDAELKRALEAMAGELKVLAADCEDRVHQQLTLPVDALRKACAAAIEATADAKVELEKDASKLSENSVAALAQLSAALSQLDKVPATFRKSLEPAAGWLRFLCRQLESLARASELVAHAAPTVAQEIATAMAALVEEVGKLASTLESKFAKALVDLANEAETSLKTGFVAQATAKLDAILRAVADDSAEKAINALEDAERALDEGEGRLRKLYAQVVSSARSALDTAANTIVRELCDLATPASKLISKKVQEVAGKVRALADTARDELKKAITAAGEDCNLLLDGVRKELKVAEDWARQQAQGALTEVLSSEAGHQIERYVQTAATAYDVGSKALSLARAVGNLPKITPLAFDIDVAAYVFDGAKPEIKMTPAVAQLLNQGEELLEAVGLKVPCERLLDKLMPDLGQANRYFFSDIFKKFGGIDFSGLFKNFKLPQLTSQNIRVTQGSEKSTRRAWVDTTVAFNSPAYEELFGGPVAAVGLERMALDAFTGVETRVVDNSVQQPVNKTHASLLADWVLLGGGQRLVTFRQVALKYDGASGFDFDLKPENVELHPSLKFISEFIARFKKNLPPAIQIEEEGGRPVGVNARTTVVIDDLPDLGAVSIGPIDMRSSLGLRLEKYRGLAISSAFSLGNKQAPIFLQISWLGGGCWLEARAKYLDGKVTPSMSIGLSLGAMRSFNLAGVARGSFSVLLFCYVEIDDAGDRIAIGLSMTGSALIVGFINANVSLLLEAHHSGGKTEGTGRLDVEVKISWFFTFRFKQSVTHSF